VRIQPQWVVTPRKERKKQTNKQTFVLMLVYKNHLLFNMHGMNIKVKKISSLFILI